LFLSTRFRAGPFGATFQPGLLTPSEATLYAARPGLRLWKADINGSVQKTLIFANSATNWRTVFEKYLSQSESETSIATVDLPTAQFGLLQFYSSGLLLSFTSSDVFIISPEAADWIEFVYSDVGNGILDVAINRDEIFVLRQPSEEDARPLIMLAQKSAVPRLFAKDAPASSMCTESHRESVL